MDGDYCDIDSRYECNYGDAVVCDHQRYSSDYQKICECDRFRNKFVCKDYACPNCGSPAAELLEGDTCLTPFNYGCNHGDGELCCEGE
jgi:hypothetical protein